MHVTLSAAAAMGCYRARLTSVVLDVAAFNLLWCVFARLQEWHLGWSRRLLVRTALCGIRVSADGARARALRVQSP